MLGPDGGGDDAVSDASVDPHGTAIYSLVRRPGGLHDAYEGTRLGLGQPGGDPPPPQQLRHAHRHLFSDIQPSAQGDRIDATIKESPTVGQVPLESPLCQAFRAAIHRDQERGDIPKKAWQKAAAKRLDMSQSQVSDLYSGKREKVDWDSLIKLVHFTGRTADELLGLGTNYEVTQMRTELRELHSQFREVLSSVRPKAQKPAPR